MSKKILINLEQPRIVKKMISVFSLANNYHSIVASDLEEDIKTLLIEEILLNWNKHLFIYVKNGHDKYRSLENIQNLDDALDFAKCSFIKAWSHK